MTTFVYTFDTDGDLEGWSAGTATGGALVLTGPDIASLVILTGPVGAEITATFTATLDAGATASFAIQAGPNSEDNAEVVATGTGDPAEYVVGPRLVTEAFGGQFAVSASLAELATLSIDTVTIEVSAPPAAVPALFPYGETVTRLRGTPVEDPYSGEETDLDWSNPAALEIPGCAFDPGSSDEPLAQGRNAVITQPRLFVAAGVDVTARDRLVVRGRTWQVDGDPADFRHPMTGWHPGVVINLKAVNG